MSDTRLNRQEIEFLKWDHGLTRVIHRASGEIHAVRQGRLIFVGWNDSDVRRMNPAMRAISPR